MTQPDASPLAVEVLRGDRVESSHLVDAVVMAWADDGPEVVEAWGDPDRLIMARSAAKPLQAMPLITTGAAKVFGLNDVELALACASHNGEKAQVDRVDAWVHRIGCTVADLECGSQHPSPDWAKAELWASGAKSTALHNNCSGKHTGFLTVCRHLGIDPAGYHAFAHPLQADHVTPAVAELCAVDVSDQAPAIDGCGIPVWSMPLRALARGWLALSRHRAGRILLRAMVDQPYFVAGTDRACTRIMSTIMSEAAVPVAVKVGAEGVYGAVVLGPDGDRAGPAVAVKVHDGATRAAEVAVEWILHRLGVHEPGPHRITNHAGTEVGAMQVIESPPARSDHAEPEQAEPLLADSGRGIGSDGG